MKQEACTGDINATLAELLTIALEPLNPYALFTFIDLGQTDLSTKGAKWA